MTQAKRGASGAIPRPLGRPGMPVVGLEAEFELWIDGERVKPETYWRHPAELIGRPLMRRTASSSQLPSGGAVYFDAGVVEVVTPVIELAPSSSARVVRSLWEQIAFLRAALTRWERRAGRHARLQGFSAHYNVSFDAQREEERTADRLARLLAYVLPLPVALLGGNRRSTGVGVRPRSNRIEVTADFTPDPGLTIATVALLTGIVRGMQAWPSYDPEMLDRRGVPVVDGVVPGRHTSRRGWLTRDYHFPRSPFTASVDARLWPTRDGRLLSLRGVAREVAWMFRHWIRRHADAFTTRLLFGVLEGQSPSLLELPDRPWSYEDVGRACRWGKVLPELAAVPRDGRWSFPRRASWSAESFQQHVAERDRQRRAHQRRQAREVRRAGGGRPSWTLPPAGAAGAHGVPPPSVAHQPARSGYRGLDRRVGPPDGGDFEDAPRLDRRRRPLVRERRIQPLSLLWARTPFPDRALTRSAYERVFLKLVSGGRLASAGETYRPTGMRGWYHAVFRRDSDGRERVFSIDELLGREADWR